MGMLTVPGGKPGIWHVGPDLFPPFCMCVLYSGIRLTLSGPLAPVSGCPTMHLTSSNTLAEEQLWLPIPAAEVSLPEISHS